MTTFSIIVPTLNAEKYLSYTLLSILNQSFRDFEVIIVDSLSKDSTFEIVKGFADDRVLFISKQDSSMYEAINHGLSVASSDIICYLNSDDLLYDSNVLMNLHDILFLLRKEPALAYGNCSFVDSKSVHLFNRRSFQENYSSALKRGRVCFAQPSAFWTRSLYSTVGGFDESFRLASDFDFFLRALKVCRHNLSMPFCASSFRLHPDSLSNTRSEQLSHEVKLIQFKHGYCSGSTSLYEIKPKLWNIDNYLAAAFRLPRSSS